MEEIPDNLNIITFNDAYRNTYSLINIFSKNINAPFEVITYFNSRDSDSNQYALFYAHLEYFNTRIFLIKNFSEKDVQQNTLFEIKELEYLVELMPPQMYIMLLYSNEIKYLDDIKKLIKSDELGITVSLLKSKKIIKRLHSSIQNYWPDNDE
ncbi:MAG: hypothetical protein AB1304_01530 [Bacteroidota bacterium]